MSYKLVIHKVKVILRYTTSDAVNGYQGGVPQATNQLPPPVAQNLGFSDEKNKKRNYSLSKDEEPLTILHRNIFLT